MHSEASVGLHHHFILPPDRDRGDDVSSASVAACTSVGVIIAQLAHIKFDVFRKFIRSSSHSVAYNKFIRLLKITQCVEGLSLLVFYCLTVSKK